jgi:hypothetical protein
VTQHRVDSPDTTANQGSQLKALETIWTNPSS